MSGENETERLRAELAERQERLARLRGYTPPATWPAEQAAIYERAVEDVLRWLGDLDVEPPPAIPSEARIVSAAVAAYREALGMPQRDHRPGGLHEQAVSAALTAAKKAAIAGPLDVRQLLVHPALWDALVAWHTARGLDIGQVPTGPNDLPTYCMTPGTCPPRRRPTMPDLPDDLRTRLSAAGAVYRPTTRPDDVTLALASEVRAAGGCAHISTGTNRPDSDPNPWHHEVCIGEPDHLDYHESVAGMLWSIDRMEYERRAERTIADLAEQLQHAIEGHIEKTSLFREMTTGPAGVRLSLQPAREVVALWAAAARGMLGDAPNYSETPISIPADVDEGLADGHGVEMTVRRGGEMDEFVFRLQRAGRLTPHQARELAEKRATAAEELLTRVRELHQGTHWCADPDPQFNAALVDPDRHGQCATLRILDAGGTPPAVERDEHGRPALGTRVTVTVTGTVDPGRMDGTQVYISASQPELHDDLWLDQPTLTITPAKDRP